MENNPSSDADPSPPYRHFLDLKDICPDQLRAILDQAKVMKAARTGWPKGRHDADAALRDHIVALIFEKSSTRTRASFDVGVKQMGGAVLSFSAQDMQLGRGESIEDTARALSRYVDMIMLRAKSHDSLMQLADAATVPVINGLTDRSHPCQIMADIMTVEEHLGPIKGRTLAWLGDGNNVVTSLIEAAYAFGLQLKIASPKGYEPQIQGPNAAFHQDGCDGEVVLMDDPIAAVKDADVVITDTWISMGQEAEAKQRLSDFAPYQVTETLLAHANEHAIFMHCLPAHRGEEVASHVIDGPQSVIWDQVENRLHVQKAIMRWCLNK